MKRALPCLAAVLIAACGPSTDPASPLPAPPGTGLPGSTPLPLPLLRNGGFEEGTLRGWQARGAVAVESTDAYQGSFAARAGDTAPSGDSALWQTFYVPVGTPILSFWYKPHCADPGSDDASATLHFESTNTTTVLLAETCTNTNQWVQLTSDLSAAAGQQVTLTLGNHDGGDQSKPSYTLYDEVTLSAATVVAPPPDPPPPDPCTTCEPPPPPPPPDPCTACEPPPPPPPPDPCEPSFLCDPPPPPPPPPPPDPCELDPSWCDPPPPDPCTDDECPPSPPPDAATKRGAQRRRGK